MLKEFITWGLFLGFFVAPVAGQSGPNVYVVDFTTRDLQKNALTAKFTHDFELALAQAGCYGVLESSEYSRLLTELDRERGIADIGQLSDSALSNLKTEQAEIVVFGEVFDDVDSGQVNITVTFQKFDRTKVLIKSILLARGKASDAESRQEAMGSLASGLCQRTATIRRTTMNEFIFELEECRKQGRNVTCELLVTNNGEDRDLYVGNYAGRYGKAKGVSRAYSEFSDEAVASRVVLARREGDRKGVQNTLVSGRPATLEIYFEGVSSRTTMLSRLDVECWESEREVVFTVQFRNIQLKQ